MKSIVAGTARNIEHCWESTQRSLELLTSALDDYVLIIVESNSTDNTVTLLNEWCLKDPRRYVVCLGELSEKDRVKRIAYCRNVYMDFLTVQNYFNKFEFMIVLDLDNALQLESDVKRQLESCFIRDDWDAIGSNRRGRYYDIWALRSNELGCVFDCWNMVDRQTSYYNGKILSSHADRIDMFIRRFQIVINRWIVCESVFGGMVVYKTSKIHNRLYDGTNTCEHVEFNKGLRILINPELISGGPCEHLV